MLQLSNADKSDETEQPGGHDDIDLDLDTEEDNNNNTNNTNNQNNTTLATSITSSINYFGQHKQQMPTNMLSADSNNRGILKSSDLIRGILEKFYLIIRGIRSSNCWVNTRST